MSQGQLIFMSFSVCPWKGKLKDRIALNKTRLFALNSNNKEQIYNLLPLNILNVGRVDL